MAKIGCALCTIIQFHRFNIFTWTSSCCAVILKVKEKTRLHELFVHSGSTPTVSVSMHSPSVLCSTSKTSEKCSSSWRWASTDRVCWQLAFSAYEPGQDGLEISPSCSPDRSSEQLTKLKKRVHRYHHHCFKFPFFFTSPPPHLPASAFPIFTSCFTFVPSSSLFQSFLLTSHSVDVLNIRMLFVPVQVCLSASR